jgi:hypothetical protein
MGAIDTPSFFPDHAYYRVFLLVHWSGLIWSVWSGSDQAKLSMLGYYDQRNTCLEAQNRDFHALNGPLRYRCKPG